MKTRSYLGNHDFTCAHCRGFVSANPDLAGVNNRNHCPYCLWSRHLDLYSGGDRLCACKGPMKPVGLTLKRANKKYLQPGQGELMIIHHCQECGGVSINRMAADDDNETLLEVFQGSLSRLNGLTDRLTASGITALGPADEALVRKKLYGWRLAPVEMMLSM
jgi:hypothetical protein